MKKENNLQISMLIQTILGVAGLTFVVASFFEEQFLPIVEAILGLLFLVMAYNNYKIYHRKVFTALYLLVAVLSLGFFFLEIFRG